MARFVVLIVLMLACQRSPAVPSGAVVTTGDCVDAECRVQRVVDAWASSDIEGALVLRTLENPEERVKVARRLIELGSVSPALCDAAGEASFQAYCRQLLLRPHLFEPARAKQAVRRREGGGPVDTELLPTSATTSRYHGVKPWQPKCVGALEPCATSRAQDLARRGSGEAAAAACLAITAGKMRSECMFRAAEAMNQAAGASGWDEATALCLEAAEYQPHCLAHLVSLASLEAPVADDPRPGAWDHALAHADALQAIWHERDAYFSSVIVDRFWSEALRYAYLRAARVTGDPIDTLPAEALPHVRAAAAYRLVELHEVTPVGLSGWVSALEEALALRSEVPGVAVQRAELPHAQDLMPAEQPPDRRIGTVSYLGTARRFVAMDPAADNALCVLEASRQIDLANLTLFEEAVNHPDPVVRRLAEVHLNQARSLPSGMVPGHL